MSFHNRGSRGRGGQGRSGFSKSPRGRNEQGFGRHEDSNKKPKSSLDEQTCGYYRRVAETLENFDGDQEEKDLFLNNVFNQLESEAGTVAKDQTVSHIVEKLLCQCSEKHLVSFMGALAEHWTDLCTSKVGSHVLQTLCENVFKILSRHQKRSSVEDEILDKVIAHFCDFCQVLLEHLDTFVKDVYASHVVRAALEVSGGVKVAEKVIRSRLSRDQRKYHQVETSKTPSSFTPPSEVLEIFDSFGKKIFDREDMKDFVYSQISSPVLQTLLLVCEKRNPKQCKKFSKKLVKKHDIFARTKKEEVAPGYEISISSVAASETGSHLVDLLIQLMPEEMLEDLFSTQFKGKVLDYCLHSTGNFVVQKLLTRVNQEQFEEIFSALKSHIEDLLASNREGVIVKMAEAAVRLGTKQEKLLKALMSAFHCYKPPERQSKCMSLFASLATYEVFYKIPEESEEDDEKNKEPPPVTQVPLLLTTINYHGAMLLQQLLQFGNPKMIISSFSDLKPVEVRNIAADPKGSHVIEAMLESSAVGEKTRDVIYNKLKGWYVDLACDKNGSRAVDSLWNHATMKQKTLMAEELSKQEAKLTGDVFGKFVHRNCGLHHFVYRRKDWQEMQTGEIKKRKLFQEILGSEGGPQQKKKRDKEEQEMEEASASLLLGDEDSVGLSLSGLDLIPPPPDTKKKSKKDDSNADSESEDNKRTKKRKKTSNIDSESDLTLPSETTDSNKKQKKHKKKKSDADSEMEEVQKKELIVDSDTSVPEINGSKKDKRKKSNVDSDCEPMEVERTKKNKKKKSKHRVDTD